MILNTKGLLKSWSNLPSNDSICGRLKFPGISDDVDETIIIQLRLAKCEINFETWSRKIRDDYVLIYLLLISSIVSTFRELVYSCIYQLARWSRLFHLPYIFDDKTKYISYRTSTYTTENNQLPARYSNRRLFKSTYDVRSTAQCTSM